MATTLTTAATQVFGDNWPKRRRWMVRILVWAMVNVQAILVAAFYNGTENALLENALIALLALIASILGTYVFGAVWDDNNKRSYLSDTLTSYQATTIPTVADMQAKDIPPEGYGS